MDVDPHILFKLRQKVGLANCIPEKVIPALTTSGKELVCPFELRRESSDSRNRSRCGCVQRWRVPAEQTQGLPERPMVLQVFVKEGIIYHVLLPIKPSVVIKERDHNISDCRAMPSVDQRLAYWYQQNGKMNAAQEAKLGCVQPPRHRPGFDEQMRSSILRHVGNGAS